MSDTEYHKLYAPFKRLVEGPRRGKLEEGQWLRPEFDVLSNQDWTWTEKVNGTNVRIIWDGHKVRIGGRTGEAQMPLILRDMLGDLFTEELLENQFHGNPVVLYGEGYGARVHAGSGIYSVDPSFVLFDAMIGSWWLLPEKLTLVALQMGLQVAPPMMIGSIGEAIALVKSPTFTSSWGNFKPEGLVGKPPLGLTGRDGDRLMIKIKPKDFL